MVGAEAFFEKDCGDVDGEALGVAVEFSAREGEVVRVAGVCGSNGLRGAGQAAVHAVGAEISERWECWRPLREVGARVRRAGLSELRRIDCRLIPDSARAMFVQMPLRRSATDAG